jgi:hypothetical protein
MYRGRGRGCPVIVLVLTPRLHASILWVVVMRASCDLQGSNTMWVISRVVHWLRVRVPHVIRRRLLMWVWRSIQHGVLVVSRLFNLTVLVLVFGMIRRRTGIYFIRMFSGQAIISGRRLFIIRLAPRLLRAWVILRLNSLVGCI